MHQFPPWATSRSRIRADSAVYRRSTWEHPDVLKAEPADMNRLNSLHLVPAARLLPTTHHNQAVTFIPRRWLPPRPVSSGLTRAMVGLVEACDNMDVAYARIWGESDDNVKRNKRKRKEGDHCEKIDVDEDEDEDEDDYGDNGDNRGNGILVDLLHHQKSFSGCSTPYLRTQIVVRAIELVNNGYFSETKGDQDRIRSRSPDSDLIDLKGIDKPLHTPRFLGQLLPLVVLVLGFGLGVLGSYLLDAWGTYGN